MKFSFSTLAGILIGFGLCIWAVASSTKEFHIFFHLESFAIVIGGTFATTLVGFRLSDVNRALLGMVKIFTTSPSGPLVLREDIKMMCEWAGMAQRGLGTVEDDFTKRKNPDHFLKFAVELLMNGYKEHDLRLFLGDFIESSHNRAMIHATILNLMGGHAPAFGMVGTLVGLVIMLSNMGSDPSAIGPAMAMSMLATLYGVMFARLIFMPAASKIQQNLEIEKYRRYMQLEGIALIADKKPPSYIQDRLNSLMNPAFAYSKDGGASKGAALPAGKKK